MTLSKFIAGSIMSVSVAVLLSLNVFADNAKIITARSGNVSAPKFTANTFQGVKPINLKLKPVNLNYNITSNKETKNSTNQNNSTQTSNTENTNSVNQSGKDGVYTITLDTKGGGELKNSSGWKKIGTDLYTRQFTANDSFPLPDVVPNKDNVYLYEWCGFVQTKPSINTWTCTQKLDKNTIGDRKYHAVYNDQGEFDSTLKGKYYSFNGQCYFSKLQNSMQGWKTGGMCYDMSKGTWWVRHEGKTYKGTVKCSSTDGRYAVSGTPSDTKGENCWCKTSLNWVFRTKTFQSGYNCADVCGINCASGVIDDKDFRSILDSKEKDTTYTITLYPNGGKLTGSLTGWTQNGDVYTTPYTDKTYLVLPSWVKRNNNEKFAGWCSDKELKHCGGVSVNIYHGTTGNKTYYAKYITLTDKDIQSVEYKDDGQCRKYIKTNEVSGWEDDSSACKGMKKGTAWVKENGKKYELTQKCSTTKGEEFKAGTPADSSGQYCWCKAQMSKSWVYADSVYSCENGCISRCQSVTSAYKEFRSALEK